jgi:hypothetical protein
MFVVVVVVVSITRMVELSRRVQNDLIWGVGRDRPFMFLKI